MTPNTTETLDYAGARRGQSAARPRDPRLPSKGNFPRRLADGHDGRARLLCRLRLDDRQPVHNSWLVIPERARPTTENAAAGGRYQRADRARIASWDSDHRLE